MNSVIKGASYVLVHTPDMVLYNGTTQTTERVVNPDSEYLKAVPEHLRSYEEAVSSHIMIRKKKEQNVTENMVRSCRRKNSCFWYRHAICLR